MIIRVKKSDNYSVIANQALRDRHLSAKAKGIFAYVMTLPNDWKLYVKELCSHFTDGRDSIYSGLKELLVAGYAQRQEVRGEGGQYRGTEYVFLEKLELGGMQPEVPKSAPLPENPDTVLPEAGSPDSEDPQLLNTNSNQILTPLNTEGVDAPTTGNPKNFVDEYHDRFLEKTTIKPVIDYSKETRVYKAHLKSFGIGHQRVMAALYAFFEDPWQADQGYNLVYFWRQIQKYLLSAEGIQVHSHGSKNTVDGEFQKALAILRQREAADKDRERKKNSPDREPVTSSGGNV